MAAPGAVKAFESGIAKIRKIKYYKHEIESKAKFHITLGHQTILGACYFFTPIHVAVYVFS